MLPDYALESAALPGKKKMSVEREVSSVWLYFEMRKKFEVLDIEKKYGISLTMKWPKTQKNDIVLASTCLCSHGMFSLGVCLGRVWGTSPPQRRPKADET